MQIHRPHRARPNFERLETRQLMASDWQNAVLPCDTNRSGLVTGLDALVVLNSINEEGARALPPANGQTIPFSYDVNGDSQITGLDALIVLNAINKYNQPLSVRPEISEASDPNRNGVVLVPGVVISGTSLPDVKIEARLAEGENTATRGVANEEGQFSITVQIPVGVHTVRVQATDDLGRSQEYALVVRHGNAIEDWNAAMLDVVRRWTTTSDDPFPGRVVTAAPPRVALQLATMHIAMFDTINAIEARYESYLPLTAAIQQLASNQPSANAAIASAAFDVARALYPLPLERTTWDATLAESLALVPESDAKQRGITLGQQIAAQVLNARANDGSDAASNYQPTGQVGDWARTPPDFTPPLLPHWGQVRSFGVPNLVDFRPAPPPSLDSAEYAAAVDEVMQLGSLTSSVRTVDQAEIAQLWSDGSGTVTPPGHWNQIAIDAMQGRNLTSLEQARLLALLNIGLADAGIGAWEAKYHYDTWRPIDAIRKADLDNNPDTLPDPNWFSLIKTPPFPSYVSGHSTFSAAASRILGELLGENTPIVVLADSHSGPSQQPIPDGSPLRRSYDSFAEATIDSGLSRIYGGIHYSFDNTAGQTLGARIGDYVIDHLLLPKPLAQ
jgi:membrane-associated phospholipid phosphatase